jgi:hypothetical protein
MSSPESISTYKRCLGCGYILDGLPENRCPECGREFDPNDGQTYHDDREDYRSNPLWPALISFALSIGGTLSIVILMHPRQRLDVFGGLVICVFVGWLLAAMFASQCVEYLKRPECPIRGRTVAALIVNVVALCPLFILLAMLLYEWIA